MNDLIYVQISLIHYFYLQTWKWKGFQGCLFSLRPISVAS